MDSMCFFGGFGVGFMGNLSCWWFLVVGGVNVSCELEVFGEEGG